MPAVARAGNSARALLLTGVPGVGKTTLVRAVAAALSGRRLRGFTTDEIRQRGERAGFRMVPFGEQSRIMAHVSFRGPARVGRYGVDVAAIDAVCDTELALDPDAELYLVDEIGKMECFSTRFVAAVRRLFLSDRPVVATVARRGGGLIEEIKRRRDVVLWEVSVANRDALVSRVLGWIDARLDGG